MCPQTTLSMSTIEWRVSKSSLGSNSLTTVLHANTVLNFCGIFYFHKGHFAESTERAAIPDWSSKQTGQV